MRQVLVLALLLCVLLSGCGGLLDGRYEYVETHPVEQIQPEEETLSAANYSALLRILRELVEEGTESALISVARYDQERVGTDMERAVQYIRESDPIGAYAVSEVVYELGTSAGQSAVSVNISYLHDRSELRKIQRPENWNAAMQVIADALDNCDASVVMYVADYQEMDFAQWIAAYAMANPDRVMEVPEVTANLYPDTGSKRVVELKFTYQNTRDALRTMQTAVSRLFAASSIYADSEGSQQDRFFKLYSFLMGLSPQFQIETSITPAYSLLQHGVGDSRAFATVYAAMCARAELECVTVTGTKAGEPWYWNIICCDGVYYHLDLLESNGKDAFELRLDEEMSGYVWDYSAYPACVEPQTETAEETAEES